MNKKYLLIAFLGAFSASSVFSYNVDHFKMLSERFSSEGSLCCFEIDGLDLSDVRVANCYNFSRGALRGCNFSGLRALSANFKHVDFSPTDSISSKISLLDNERRRPCLRLALLNKWMKYCIENSRRSGVDLREMSLHIGNIKAAIKSLLDLFPYLDKNRPYLERIKLTDDYQSKFKKQIDKLRKQFVCTDINTSFVEAKVNCSNFAGANCRSVNFTNASLVGCRFTGAILTGAVFKDVILMNTSAGDGTDRDRFADFRGALGLTEEQKLYLWNHGGLVDLNEDQKRFFAGIADELKQHQKNYLGII